MAYPEDCTICMEEGVHADLFDGDLELAAKPFKGASPSVILAGQDPTVTKRQVCSVLDLNNPDGRLYEYVVGDILETVGLNLDDVYATDLVKCRFPVNYTPRSITQKYDMTIKEFLSPFFYHCRQWFVEEVREVRPKIIMSLGEPVHQLLVEEFAWAVPTQMRQVFGQVYLVSLFADKFLYAPCIHYSSKDTDEYFRHRWNTFVENLETAVRASGIH